MRNSLKVETVIKLATVYAWNGGCNARIVHTFQPSFIPSKFLINEYVSLDVLTNAGDTFDVISNTDDDDSTVESDSNGVLFHSTCILNTNPSMYVELANSDVEESHLYGNDGLSEDSLE